VTLPPPSILPPPSPECQLEFRLPRPAWTTQLLAPFPLWILLVLNGTAPWWTLVILLGLLPVGIARRDRVMLSLDSAGVTTTMRRPRFVPWHDVVRFEPGAPWLGGTRIVTTAGVLRSPVPCSSMGFRARPDQIAQLEAFRLRWSDAAPS
jgi:hypothetical protein